MCVCVSQAKLEASISWLLTKAYGHNVPAKYAQPFYDDPQVTALNSPLHMICSGVNTTNGRIDRVKESLSMCPIFHNM